MVTLQDLKEETQNYSGNPNPTIWVKSDLQKDNGKSIPIQDIIIDEDGDIVLAIVKEDLV